LELDEVQHSICGTCNNVQLVTIPTLHGRAQFTLPTYLQPPITSRLHVTYIQMYYTPTYRAVVLSYPSIHT
jgi:hypothetical protein